MDRSFVATRPGLPTTIAVKNDNFDSYVVSFNSREDSDQSRDGAVRYGIYFFVLTVSYGITLIQYVYYGYYYAMRVRVALSSLIYRKVGYHIFLFE